MARVRVSVTIAASPQRVWEAIEDIGTHVEWMDDADAIRFRDGSRRGIGTAFECDTRVGPFHLVDSMVITEWKPARAMGVCHTGLVTGTGVFTLRPTRRGRTRFTWSERLWFPWWMGGPFGATAGSLVLRRVWRRNLANLKRLIEAQRSGI